MSLNSTHTSLDLILKISRELTTTLKLEDALSRVIQLSMENVGAERGSLIAVNDIREPIAGAIFADGHLIPHTDEQLNTIINFGLAGQVMKSQQPVQNRCRPARRRKHWQVQPKTRAGCCGSAARPKCRCRPRSR